MGFFFFKQASVLCCLLRSTFAIVLTSTHTLAKSQSTLFESAFEDSGHWDFVLLKLCDYFCSLWVSSVGPISEFSFMEKASHRFIYFNNSFYGKLSIRVEWFGFKSITQALSAFILLIFLFFMLVGLGLFLA